MDGKIDLLTLLALIVAVIVILKLRSVLGRRTGDDETRIEQQIRAEQARERERAAAQDKVVTLPRREREAPAGQPEPQVAMAEAEARIKSFAGGDRGIEQGLLAVLRADPSFDAGQFMQGARQAYEMIVTAFAEGNRQVLKDLLSRDVFEGFSAAIADREGRGEIIDQSFVGISKADIIEASCKGGKGSMTVKFVSQLISATRDKAGQVVGGDPQKIKEVTDIWTFERETASRNPNWYLVATQAPS
jgi:predicted lipid-binding transport protein (Tim44 family)